MAALSSRGVSGPAEPGDSVQCRHGDSEVQPDYRVRAACDDGHDEGNRAGRLDVARAVVVDGTLCSCEQMKAERLKLAARSTAAPFSMLLMAEMASACVAGSGARSMRIVAVVAMVSELTPRTVAPLEALERGALTVCGILCGGRCGKATAPAMEDQTSTNITAFVTRNGADCSWTLGAASQITL